jgi:hypothetical protein
LALGATIYYKKTGGDRKIHAFENSANVSIGLKRASLGIPVPVWGAFPSLQPDCEDLQLAVGRTDDRTWRGAHAASPFTAVKKNVVMRTAAGRIQHSEAG